MTLGARAWRLQFPYANPQIQFNYPHEVMVIATISAAIEQHFISVNEDGKQLVDSLIALFSYEREPTAFMLRLVTEFIDDERLR